MELAVFADGVLACRCSLEAEEQNDEASLRRACARRFALRDALPERRERYVGSYPTMLAGGPAF